MISGEWWVSALKVAMRLLDHIRKKKVPFRLLRVIREVLVWGEGDSVVGLEFKFFHIPEMLDDTREFRKLLGLP